MDILYLDDVKVPGHGDPLADVIREDVDELGGYLSVRYWTAEIPRSDDDMITGTLRELDGEGDVEYCHRYSEITGYLWTDEDIKIGGHDLLAELRAQVGRYCLLEIGYSKEARPGD